MSGLQLLSIDGLGSWFLKWWHPGLSGTTGNHLQNSDLMRRVKGKPKRQLLVLGPAAFTDYLKEKNRNETSKGLGDVLSTWDIF